jgi:aconitate hydratase A / 2-methylisocitrate dehydratase
VSDPGLKNSFGTRDQLKVGGTTYSYHRLSKLEQEGFSVLDRLPFSLRVLLENLLRCEDGLNVTRQDIEALLHWNPKEPPTREISFMPARVLMQDFTGVPAVVDLAAMRDAMAALGGDPTAINPLQPAELVIDHSVQVDEYGQANAFFFNAQKEMERNRERYAFLKWGQRAFHNFRAVPPDTGIVHQINLEYLATVVFSAEKDGERWAYPDTLVGTDSHTTMINGLGVLGWGVGGIEAEAAMLGQPCSMLIPEVVGFRLTGSLPPGATATDLVLTVTQMLRKKGVVGKFVEFYGEGLASLTLADRATIANMAPEYGATMGFFPVDAETVAYLRFTGRPPEVVALVEAYCKEQGLFRTERTQDPVYSDTLELALGTVEPSLAGPKRPQDRVPLKKSKRMYREALVSMMQGQLRDVSERAAARFVDEGGDSAPIDREHYGPLKKSVTVELNGESFELEHGAVVIAAITSCTNTSNPSVMLQSGLLARNAVERGLSVKPWVKTSLAPGSKVVTEYLKEAGVMPYLEKLGYHLVGYGCTTCIGNSGPLPDPITAAIDAGQLVAVSVLSGNRNFEGRVHPKCRANYLASPPLVVTYALAGTMDIDLETEPLGHDQNGKPVFLREIWPTEQEVREAVRVAHKPDQYQREYGAVFQGGEQWNALSVPEGHRYAWEPDSTYIRKPPYFDGMSRQPGAIADIRGARLLALLGDSVTTDHISPAGNISKTSPAARYLIEHDVQPADFNSYGARRGNHEVMVRGTFANIRLRNLLAPGTEGGVTRHQPSGEQMSIFDASVRYAAEGVPLLVIAGKEYGTGSSRDWAAKGPMLLGIRAVLAESYERIHRSNLVGMGILPLQFVEGQNAETLNLTGVEEYDIAGLGDLRPRGLVTVKVRKGGETRDVSAVVRIDTPVELDYYRHGGILLYVLRRLLA